MQSDEQVVESILLGNEENFSLLLDKYYPKLITFCLKLFVSKDDVEDILQEIFMKVYKNLYKFNKSWRFNTWIYRVALNTLKDIKKKKKITTTELNYEAMIQNNSFHDNCIENLHNNEIIKKMFTDMDEKLKTMFILRYYEEMSFKEIGLIFNMSSEAVRMKIFRAKDRLYKEHSINYFGGGINEMHI